MKPNPIIILSDTIRSGKTTALKEWAQGTHGIKGFLSPDRDGKRVFQELGTQSIIPMEVNLGDLQVGRFQFNQSAFSQVETAVLKAWKASETSYLILDEIGPLEIRKKQGFHQLLLNLQHKTKQQPPVLVIVVRDTCLKEFLERYNFKVLKIYNVKDFKHKFLSTN